MFVMFCIPGMQGKISQISPDLCESARIDRPGPRQARTAPCPWDGGDSIDPENHIQDMTRVIRQIYLSTLVTGEFSMNIKSLAIGAMMAVCSVASFADTTVFTDSSTDGFTYSFTTTDAASVFSASFMSFNTFSVTLDGSAAHWNNSPNSKQWSWDIANTIGAGSHTIAITGATSPVMGSYQYVPGTITAPVPEPETYAMMLAGLGALGFLGRRRKAA